MLVDRRIRIREDQKHTDPAQDPDPQHWFLQLLFIEQEATEPVRYTAQHDGNLPLLFPLAGQAQNLPLDQEGKSTFVFVAVSVYSVVDPDCYFPDPDPTFQLVPDPVSSGFAFVADPNQCDADLSLAWVLVT